jgi:hypothetical protein
MNAIEFETQTHNGIIEIPPEYQTWQNKTVRVILLESEEKQSLAKIPRFTAVTLKTQNFRFDREQANER